MLPAGALVALFADQVQASPRPYIPNAAAPAETAPAYLNNGPRRMFSQSFLYTTTGLTIADANAAGPDGSLTASTVSNAGSNWYIHPGAFGGFTFTAGVKRCWLTLRWKGTGSANFKLGNYPSALTLLTGTATWARYYGEFTIAVGGNASPVFITPDATSAANFEIQDFMVADGQTDPMPNWQAGLPSSGLVLGVGPGVKIPTVVGGAMDTSTGNYGLIQFNTKRTPTAVTIISVGSRVGNGSGNNYQPIVSNPQDWTQFAALNDESGGTAGPEMRWLGTALMGNLIGADGRMFDANGGGWACFTHRFDGTTVSAFYNDLKAWTKNTTKSAAAFAELVTTWVANTSIYGGYKWAAIVVYERALSDAEVKTEKAKILAHIATASAITLATMKIANADGDSIGAGTSGTPHWYQAIPLVTKAYHGENQSVGGSQIADVAGRAGAANALITALTLGARVPVMMTHVGTNDLYPSIGTFAGNPTGALNALAALSTTYRSVGSKVLHSTLIDRNSGGASATWAADKIAFNQGLRNGVGTSWDGIVDYDSDSRLSNSDGVTASNNATNFNGAVHPTTTGYGFMAAILAPAVDALGTAGAPG